MTLSARCASGYWDNLSIESGLQPKGLRGDIRIEAAGLRIGDLVERLAPGAAPWLGETVLTLRGRIASEGLRNGKAEFAGGVPVLTVRRGARSRAFRADAFKGSAEWSGKGLRTAFFDLSIDDPRVRLSGELTVDRESPAVKARLETREADIPPIRSAILALAGDVPAVRVALGVVRGGTLSRFSLEAGGTSPRDLADFGRFTGRATLSGGTITVPGIDLTLNDVGGEASLSGGILAGEGLTARLGKSSARGGTLRMGFAGKRRAVPPGGRGGRGHRGIAAAPPPPLPERELPRGDRPDPRSAGFRFRAVDPRGASLVDPSRGDPLRNGLLRAVRPAPLPGRHPRGAGLVRRQRARSDGSPGKPRGVRRLRVDRPAGFRGNPDDLHPRRQGALALGELYPGSPRSKGSGTR